ncbi:hypothetical protein MSG28_010510 [Choristoneura fumiferana]|uniref:Uncharacterized protein n=1 Tax=Choristoneura fumiferana TaxID=7141 RepID=A0ACC0KLK3_CHOFU|nr:hypothetical protein MSG28_010510 [Choristoneura fumiferana]
MASNVIMPTATTMGYLADSPVPEREESALRSILRSLDENFPQNWRDWKVIHYTMDELFGGQDIPDKVDSKMRFAVPTSDLARAFDPGATSLSERRYRAIRASLMKWPLGRALLYAPHSIMAQIHEPDYDAFMNAVKTVRPKLTKRSSVTSELRTDSPKSPEAGGSQSSATPNSKSTNIQATPRPTTPTPLSQDSSGHLLASILSQQMALMNKFCAAQVEQQEEIKALKGQKQNNVAMDLDSSFADSMVSDEPRESFVSEKNSPVHESESSEDDDTYDFMPKTTEQEPKIRKADPKALKYGIECQRLGVAPKWKFAETLESFDGTLGAITNGLIQQRLIFEEILASLPKDVRKKVKKEYLGPESKFKKNSTDLLQYVCGKRTEVIRLRRKAFTPRNKVIKQIIHEIPPSETHLFEEKMLTDVVKEQGRLAKYARQWEGAPTSIQKIIKGYRIPFGKKPPLEGLRKNSFRFTTPASPQMDLEIRNLLESGALRKSLQARGFLSTFFLRKKSDNTYRPIFNLKRLNEYVLTPKFHLVNHLQIPRHLRIKDFMMKVDISQAYFHIPIHPSHRRFLSMAYQGHVYEMTCLPFGLASAPSAFAMITNWIAQQLRRKGLRVIVYLDDFLFMHENSVVLERQVQCALTFLRNLGWHINPEKTSKKASMNLEYLGITWDSEINAKSLSGVKVTQLRKCISKLLEERLWSWHDAKVFLGKLEFAAAVIPLGRLHCRFLQRALRHLSRRDPHTKFRIPEVIIPRLIWWWENAHKSTAIHHADPSIFITTDAAEGGWGAIVNGRHMWGRWTPSQKNWHSNVKELWTVYEVLSRLGSELQGKTIMLQSDNRTTVAYIEKQGGTKSLKLLEAAEKILVLCQRMKCHLTARHIPGLTMDSGRTVQTESAARMAPQSPDSSEDISKVWKTTNRFIRLEKISSSSPVRQRRCNRQGQPIYGCIQQDMVLRPRVDFSSASDHTASPQSPAESQGSISSSDATLGQRFLGTGTLPVGSRSPFPNSESEGSPKGSPHRLASPRSRKPEIGGLDGSGWAEQVSGWPQEKIDLLECSWRKSTLKTYRPIWKRWCDWAKTTNTSVNNPSARHLADYLCYLHTVLNLRAKTIALHKSVVANFSNPLQAKELSGHPLIKRILKGIIAGDPPVKRCITWCIEDLLSFLKRYDVDESSLFAVARHTCVLLLLATGRRVHDLTLLSLENGAFEEKPGRIVFWPKFGSKTDSSSYRQSGWLLKCTSERSERRLDLVYWVKKLIYVSAERRRPSNLLNLFITTRGTAKNASRTVIAGWIRTLLKKRVFQHQREASGP